MLLIGLVARMAFLSSFLCAFLVSLLVCFLCLVPMVFLSMVRLDAVLGLAVYILQSR